MMAPELTEDQLLRYSRNILLPQVDVKGQRKLLHSSVFVVGAGGLGSPALLYLAAAGVGNLGVADGDAVEPSNLQRQIIHDTGDVGRSKAVSAREALRRLNSDCIVEAVTERLGRESIRDALRGYDVVIDGSDNFPTRFLVADCCRFEGIPLVSGAVLGFEGQLMTVLPGKGNACYRCFLPEPPAPGSVPTCREDGILGAVAGVIGGLQAVEAIKILLGLDGVLSDRILVYDALGDGFRTAERLPDPACPLCGTSPTITELTEDEAV